MYQDPKLEDCRGAGDTQSGQKKSVSSRLKELRKKNKVVKHEVCLMNIEYYLQVTLSNSYSQCVYLIRS